MNLSGNIYSSSKKYFRKLQLSSEGKCLELSGDIAKSEWVSEKEISLLQKNRLSALLTHAGTNVPYYRQLFHQNGLITDRGEIRLDRFENVPLLSRDALHTGLDRLTSEDIQARKWFFNTSGGSTGVPVKFIQDKTYADWRRAVKLLFDSWSGCSLAEKKVILWGSERDLFVGKETFKIRARRWLRNATVLNAFLMTPDKMKRYADIINRQKPNLIKAYAESLYEFASFLQRENITVHSPRAVITSAGTLFPHMRETIEAVFNTPVFNRYGSREMGDIACECNYHQGLHSSPLTHFVEILDHDGKAVEPGKLGEIVITCLTNFAMPLIRYRIGDMGSWSENNCACGRHWPLLREVSGRVTDTFIRRDGSVVSPEYLIHLVGVVLNRGWIRKFQIIQEDYDHILIRLILTEKKENPHKSYGSELLEMTEKVQLVMGADCRVGYEFPDAISPSLSNKYRFTISNVKRIS